MSIVEFYKRLSKILEDYGNVVISKTKANERIEELKKEALLAKIDTQISPSILDDISIYEEEDDASYESSYDDDGN